MSRWARHRQKVEVCYEPSGIRCDESHAAEQVELGIDDDAIASHDERSLEEHVLLDPSAASKQRWRRQSVSHPTASITKSSQTTPNQPLLMMRKGASEMEVATGYASAKALHVDELHWPEEVDGDPVDKDISLRPIDVTQKVKELESALGFKAVQKARRDQHAKRKPIPCGVQLLTGRACNFACQYCYLQDWFPFERPTPTPLTGQEVLLSLLYNPHWVPSRDFIILGDACDPFHPDLEARTLEYVEAVAPLRSPIQFSTKAAISESTASKLASIASSHHCTISVLVTITTIKNARAVEPLAPCVEDRLETIRHVSEAGLQVFVFMRPLLPGASEDFADVLAAAKQAGATGVIVGSLRVSKKIRQRLSRIKAIDIEEIDRQLQERDIDPSTLTEEQIDIQDEPMRAAIKEKADELGLVSVRRACCANAWASQMPCRKRNCLMKDILGQW